MADRLKVGDKVIVRDTYQYHGRGTSDEIRVAGTATVVKVGRRWATLKDDDEKKTLYRDREWVVDMDTGHGKPHPGGFAAGYRGLTEAGWAEHDERVGLMGRMTEATRYSSWRERLTIDQLRRVVAILEEDEE